MTIRYAHTNIISSNWRALAQFYEDVFDCSPVPPERNQSNLWLATCTGVPNAALVGVHLRLPGYGDRGPTLEIYQYTEMADKPEPVANRQGIGHLAFEVDDVAKMLDKMVAHGGRALGEIVTAEVQGAGRICLVYAADPEGNIIELQKWL